MKYFYRTLIFIYLAAGVTVAAAEKPSVHIRVTPDTIMIGDRFRMEVSVEKDLMQMIMFPEIDPGGDASPVEILSQSGVDTVSQDGRTQILRKTYELTSFESGNYDMGRYPVLYGDKNIIDTLYSEEPIMVVVDTIEVDTENDTIYDIKPPVGAPFMFGEIAGYLFGGIGILALVAGAVIILSRWLRNRRGVASEELVENLPPHVRAIQELENLHNRKLWQNGKIKSYYTELTDIIRTYLAGRYGINAMEMTTDQTVRAAARHDMPKVQLEELKRVLKTSDLVKFAKHVPTDDEHEKYYYAMYYFVEETKFIPQDVTESSETIQSNGQNK